MGRDARNDFVNKLMFQFQSGRLTEGLIQRTNKSYYLVLSKIQTEYKLRLFYQISNSVFKAELCYPDENSQGRHNDMPEGPLHVGTLASGVALN